MAEDSNESEFQSRLYTRLKDHIEENDTKFSEVHNEHKEDSQKRADIYVENNSEKSLVIEAKAPDEYLLNSEHIKQARDYADNRGHCIFSLANTNDFFLFNYTGNEVNINEIEFYYLNLRKYDSLSDVVPKILSAVRKLHYNDKLPDQEEKERIIGLLRSFHNSVSPNYIDIAKETYGRDRLFTDKVDEWAKENNYTKYDKDKQLEILAQQFTYSLANKIFFYQILRDNNIGQIHDSSLSKLNEVGAGAIRGRIKQQFKTVREHINYEPIFDHKDTAFDLDIFPKNKKGQEAIKELLDHFESINITEVDEDLIGQLYEELIPQEERERLGQFYTPPAVAESIVKWALSNENNSDSIPRILDPASGSGTFPVEIYNELDGQYDATHQDILDNINVVDVNAFPIHLTGLNLASRNILEPTNHINSFNGSFFNYSEPYETGRYDAVVGNPPYIKSKELYPDTEHFREHLKNYNPDGNKNPEYYNGTKRFSKQTDAYIYFITNSLRYLEDGGRLGFIIPDKFLSAKYGKEFQQFLLDNTKIHGVVSFSQRTFEDALVSTCLLLVEKCEDYQERENHVVDFMHIKDEFNPDELVRNIGYVNDVEGVYEYEARENAEEEEIFTSVSIKQNELEKRKGKLSYLLKAPKQVIDIIHSDKFGTLSDCAEISRGEMTGANPFFFVTDEDITQWNLPSKFLTPALKSIRNIESSHISEEDTEYYLLNTSGFIEDNDISSSEEAKKKLTETGFESLVRYIEYGESEGYHERPSCKSRNVWFNLKDVSIPDLFQPRFYNDRIFTIINDNLASSDTIQGVKFKDKDNGQAISALTNSYLYKIFLELWGRSEGGGALQVQTYEVETIPFPDIDSFTEPQIRKLEDSYNNIINNDYEGLADEVIIESLDLDISVSHLKTIQNNLVQSRVNGADAEPLIRNADSIEGDVSPFEER